ncbi:MAG: hypothetical protein PVG81_14135, partial [Desulfobacterales bacterium]
KALTLWLTIHDNCGMEFIGGTHPPSNKDIEPLNRSSSTDVGQHFSGLRQAAHGPFKLET